jgi:D-alanyl-D-alanine carboxypeptidase
MTRTTYTNASGLPDDDQITTARDQALLGRLIQKRFPRYYRYFSTESFVYHGEVMRNHNHLLGAIEGVDGIKTGFTQASGFNLVTSVHRVAQLLPVPTWFECEAGPYITAGESRCLISRIELRTARSFLGHKI